MTSGVTQERPIEIRILGRDDASMIERAAGEVFDHAVDPRLTTEFLSDARHHLAVAIEDGHIVGMASGVHYVHPDKAPELWINEVGVAATHRNRGLGRRVVACLLAHGRALGCHEAWVLTDMENVPARRMYGAAGGVEKGQQLLVEFDLASGAEGT